MTEIDLTPITRLEYDIDAILNDHAVAEPITRIELILADIVAGNTTTVVPVTRIETYLAIISGADYPVPEPVTRIETFLAIIAGEDYETPEAVTRLEGLLAEWVEKGSGIWKTVTGALIHITDALSSPVQALSVAIEPQQSGSGDPSPDNVRPITGWTGCEVNVTGVNVWDEEWELGAYNNDTGEPAPSNSQIRTKNYIPVVGGATYCFRREAGSFYIYWYDGEKNFIPPYEYKSISNKSVSVTAPQNAKYCRFYVYGTEPNNISVNYPSTDTDYHAHQGTTASVTFPDGQTVYGGTVDLVTGDGEITQVKWVEDGSREPSIAVWSEGTDYNCTLFNSFAASSGLRQADFYRHEDKFICNNRRFVSINGTEKTDANTFASYRVSGSYSFCYSIPKTLSTKVEIAAWFAENPSEVVYLLGTPIPFHVDPQQISTLQGENNIWADCGDIEITYKAQAE